VFFVERNRTKLLDTLRTRSDEYREPYVFILLLDTILNSKAVALLFKTTRRDGRVYILKSTY
jgi:hypothetical protein